MSEIDFIGDVHGHADILETVLAGLGYFRINGSWRHSDRGRRAVFLGDLIDRGPEQFRSVDIARRMRDAGDADVMLGNHEHNAIGWALTDPRRPGKHLRVHGSKNREQHRVFLEEVGEGSALHRELVEWMCSLPFYLDLDGAKACHACWHQPSIDILSAKSGGTGVLPLDDLVETFEKGSELHDAQEKVLKGLEIDLPPGFSFTDAGGHVRTTSRIRWWDAEARTYDTAAMPETGIEGLPPEPLPDDARAFTPGGEPAFFGHYWLKGIPELLSPVHACLDFSVARDGYLCAYTWRGERTLSPEGLSWAGPGIPFTTASDPTQTEVRAQTRHL